VNALAASTFRRSVALTFTLFTIQSCTHVVIPSGGAWSKSPSDDVQIVRAYARVKSVLSCDSFRRWIMPMRFLSSPDGSIVSGLEVMSSAEFGLRFEIRAGLIGEQHFLFGLVGPQAATSLGGPIVISDVRISDRDYLVNTVAHESTHVESSANGGFRFADQGHDDVTRPWLASYAFGDLVQCFAESMNVASAEACFDTMINAVPLGGPNPTRRQRRCDVATDNPSVLKIRELATTWSYCATGRWSEPEQERP